MRVAHFFMALGLSFGLMVPAATIAQPVPKECRQHNGKIKCDKPGCKKFCVHHAPKKHHGPKAHHAPAPKAKHHVAPPPPKPVHKTSCKKCDDIMRHCKGPRSVCLSQMQYCKRVCR